MKNSSIKFFRQKGMIWITFGLLLIAAALSLVLYNLFDEVRAEHASRNAFDMLAQSIDLGNQNFAEEESDMVPDYVLNPEMEMPVERINGIDYVGVLQIPSLGLQLPVISSWSYPGLKKAPCRYSGSPYLNNMIICGHNYESHFGNLKNLKEGDTAVFTDMDGNVFVYKAAVCEILNADAVEELESSIWDLTIFTCTIGGKSRITVRFELERN